MFWYAKLRKKMGSTKQKGRKSPQKFMLGQLTPCSRATRKKPRPTWLPQGSPSALAFSYIAAHPRQPQTGCDLSGRTYPPDFVIAYPKKYKSYNFSRQECKKQGFSRIGGRACYFTRLFARLPKQQKQPLIIKHLQTYFEKVTKSGKSPQKFMLGQLTPCSRATRKKPRPTWLPQGSPSALAFSYIAAHPRQPQTGCDLSGRTYPFTQ